MKQILKDIRSLKKLFSNRNFYFVFTVCPLGAFLYMYAVGKIKEKPLITGETQEMYSVATIIAAMFLVVYTAFEIIDKKLQYKNQGDKLKLKQDEKDWQKKVK